MRRLASLLLLLPLACTDGGDGTDAGVRPDADSSSCVPGDTTECTTLDEVFISGMATCGSVGRWAISECVAKEGGLCVPPDGCEEGTLCLQVDPQFGRCTDSCDPATGDGCDPGFNCQQVGDTEGICAEATQARDQPCGLGVDCVEGMCLPAYIGISQGVVAAECKLTCDADDLGNQGSCPVGERCLYNPEGFTEAQTNANGDEITCVDEAPCDGGRGFTCVPQPQVGGVCLRQRTWCGLTANLITGPLTEQLTQEDVCGFPQSSRYCEPLADGDAQVSCQLLFSFAPDLDQEGNQIPCMSTQDCPTFIGSDCIPTPHGSFCATNLKGCLAFCEGVGGDLDCGVGRTCTRLSVADYPGFFLDIQPDVGGQGEQTCTGPMDPACEASYECIQFTATRSFCARAPKICTM